jgi:hypothetical protein
MAIGTVASDLSTGRLWGLGSELQRACKPLTGPHRDRVEGNDAATKASVPVGSGRHRG